MNTSLLDYIINFSTSCKKNINDYFFKPTLHWGKRFIYIMSPREREESENEYIHYTLESVVLVAKIAGLVAIAVFIQATLYFSFYFSAAASVCFLARLPQMKVFICNCKINSENISHRFANIVTAANNLATITIGAITHSIEENLNPNSCTKK